MTQKIIKKRKERRSLSSEMADDNKLILINRDMNQNLQLSRVWRARARVHTRSSLLIYILIACDFCWIHLS